MMKHTSEEKTSPRGVGFFVLHPADVLEAISILALTHIVFLALFLGYRDDKLLYVQIVVFLLDGLIVWQLTDFVTIDPSGIRCHRVFRKSIHIAWVEVLCTGCFYHMVNFQKKRAFYYFSKKPLYGGINFTKLTTMARQSDTFIFVAKQGKIEERIRQFYPGFRFSE